MIVAIEAPTLRLPVQVHEQKDAAAGVDSGAGTPGSTDEDVSATQDGLAAQAIDHYSEGLGMGTRGGGGRGREEGKGVRCLWGEGGNDDGVGGEGRHGMQIGPWWCCCCCSVFDLSLSVVVGGGGSGDTLAVVLVHPGLHLLQHRGCVRLQGVDAEASVRWGRHKGPAHASPLLESIMLDHVALKRLIDGRQVIGEIVHDGRRTCGWWQWWSW